jgi:hypothetical protein
MAKRTKGKGAYAGNQGAYAGNQGAYAGNQGAYAGNQGAYAGNQGPVRDEEERLPEPIQELHQLPPDDDVDWQQDVELAAPDGQGKAPRKPNAWIQHIKNVQMQNRCSYKEAMKEAAKTWKKAPKKKSSNNF